MENFSAYLGEPVELILSGDMHLSGILVDVGNDIFVLYNGEDFIYVPTIHVHSSNFQYENENEIAKPDEAPIGSQYESISFRKVLNNAKGIFTELFITGHQAIHGYVTNVMNDYFIFYSPVYKTLFIPLQHLKFLIPYHHNQRPYALKNEELPLSPSNVSLSRTFEEQCRKHIGKLAIFDLGNNPKKVGKLVKLENGQIELIIARNDTIYINIHHVKTVHFP